jgi:methyl-accepting chemotaxis protein
MPSPTHLSLKHRLPLIGIVLALLPFPFAAIVVAHRPAPVLPLTARPGLTPADLDDFADSAYQAVDFSQRELARTTSIASNMMTSDHGVRQLKGRPLSWPVAGSSPVKLPPLSIRKAPLLPAANRRRAFVNEFAGLSGAQCGVFQRMNAAGDMLWIASSVPPSPSSHALGAVIPASAPPASAILAKQSYIGMLPVPGVPSVAGFEPVLRSDGAVIGMLAVSVPEKDRLDEVRQRLSHLSASSRAELFAGSNDLPVPAESLAEILANAKNRPARPVEARYKLAQKGEMIAHIRYFAPWNWLVGAAVPLSAMAVPPLAVVVPPDHSSAGLLVVFLLAALVSAVVWLRSANSITASVVSAGAKLKGNIESLLHIAAVASQPAKPGQASALDRASGAIAQAGRDATALAASVGETVLASQTCKTHSENAAAEVAAMQTAISKLTSSNSQVSGLVKEIGSIALQSRLLALNASIEAARAGHHGSSFSVVADEFGKLAERCSENAKSTTELLTSSVAVSSSSTDHLMRLREEIDSLSQQSDATTHSLANLLEAANCQARSVADIERAVATAANVPAKASGIEEKIRAEAATLEETAAGIAASVGKTAKARAPKTRSFAAKAPANNRSARRAY